MGASMLDHLKANNRAWAERMVSADADFFKRLELQQTPEYLWIGCSDSRVPANEIVDRLDDRRTAERRQDADPPAGPSAALDGR